MELDGGSTLDDDAGALRQRLQHSLEDEAAARRDSVHVVVVGGVRPGSRLPGRWPSCGGARCR
ncbi:hypothetical protein ACIBI9_59490 [Nonomuraea sp. NPDC050451]|uniref:hypothetical protein n=1 Tax=Nonomuraea sp. NPDC050451 TaxID=3364364 RepID=UPI0037998F72